MSAILLPGYNLAGRLPSVSALTRDRAWVLPVNLVSDLTSLAAGQLLRTPKVIVLSWAVRGSNQFRGGAFVGTDQTEPNRLAAVFASIALRVNAAMPDALVTPPGQSQNNFSVGQLLSQFAVLDGTFTAPLNTTPALGSDFLYVFVGTTPDSTLFTTSSGPASTGTIQRTLLKFVGFSMRVFIAPSVLPNESLDGVPWPSADDVTPQVEGAALGALVASSIMDVQISGTNVDVTEDSIAAIINEHYGVTI